MGVGRVAKLFAELQLLIGVALEVVVAGKLDGGRVRGEGLNDDFAFEFAPTGAASDLSEKLKRAFACAEVWDVQPKVRVEDTDEGDVGEVQPFGYHLSADDDVDFSLTKGLEGISQGVFPSHGIGVDSGYFS